MGSAVWFRIEISISQTNKMFLTKANFPDIWHKNPITTRKGFLQAHSMLSIGQSMNSKDFSFVILGVQ